MNDRTLISIGLIGTVIAALCCFTPVLWVVLGAVGLGALLAWADWVVVPALVFFVGLTAYGFHVRRKNARACAEMPAKRREVAQ